jgi:hypothetical protein
MSDEILDVDLYQLHVEWVRQPRLYREYAGKLADARMRLNEARSALDIVYAEQDKDVRLHPQKFEIDKITEATVKNAIMLTAAYQNADEDVIRAKHDVDVLEAMVGALDHKKKALENLVSLEMRDYFSKPREPEELRAKGRDIATDAALSRGGRKKKTPV